ncbi:MAG: sigma-70 family RNA polymerase sigma factor [Solirubrobacterales bacterium]
MTNQPNHLQAVVPVDRSGVRGRELGRIAGAGAPTDAELLRASRGDPDAFHQLYSRYSEPLFHYFARRTGSEDTALELSAETFSRVWVTRDRFEDQRDGSVAPWLYGIARNVLLMSVRRGEVERRTATRLGVLERLGIDAPVATPEPGWAEGADELLDTLPLSQRDALRLRIIDELDYDEVAEALGTSRSAARVRVHRGLAALRKRLSNQKENHR